MNSERMKFLAARRTNTSTRLNIRLSEYAGVPSVVECSTCGHEHPAQLLIKLACTGCGATVPNPDASTMERRLEEVLNKQTQELHRLLTELSGQTERRFVEHAGEVWDNQEQCFWVRRPVEEGPSKEAMKRIVELAQEVRALVQAVSDNAFALGRRVEVLQAVTAKEAQRGEETD